MTLNWDVVGVRKWLEDRFGQDNGGLIFAKSPEDFRDRLLAELLNPQQPRNEAERAFAAAQTIPFGPGMGAGVLGSVRGTGGQFITRQMFQQASREGLQAASAARATQDIFPQAMGTQRRLAQQLLSILSQQAAKPAPRNVGPFMSQGARTAEEFIHTPPPQGVGATLRGNFPSARVRPGAGGTPAGRRADVGRWLSTGDMGFPTPRPFTPYDAPTVAAEMGPSINPRIYALLAALGGGALGGGAIAAAGGFTPSPVAPQPEEPAWGKRPADIYNYQQSQQFSAPGRGRQPTPGWPTPSVQKRESVLGSIEQGGAAAGPSQAAPKGRSVNFNSLDELEATPPEREMQNAYVLNAAGETEHWQAIQGTDTPEGKPGPLGWKYIRTLKTKETTVSPDTEARVGLGRDELAQRKDEAAQLKQRDENRLRFDQLRLELDTQAEQVKTQLAQRNYELNSAIEQARWSDAVAARRQQTELQRNQQALEQQRLQLGQQQQQFEQGMARQQQTAQIMSNPMLAYLYRIMGQQIPGMARGGTMKPGGMAIVGEAGPELAINKGGKTTIMPMDAMKTQLMMMAGMPMMQGGGTIGPEGADPWSALMQMAGSWPSQQPRWAGPGTTLPAAPLLAPGIPPTVASPGQFSPTGVPLAQQYAGFGAGATGQPRAPKLPQYTGREGATSFPDYGGEPDWSRPASQNPPTARSKMGREGVSAFDVATQRIGADLLMRLPSAFRDYLFHYLIESGATTEPKTGRLQRMPTLSLQDLATLPPEVMGVIQALNIATGSYPDLVEASQRNVPQRTPRTRFIGG